MRDAEMMRKRTGKRNRGGLQALRAGALAALIFVAPVISAAAPVSHKEVRIPRVDRRAIENLQRWVNGGHDLWCKDARAVASAEMRRVAPEFSGEQFDLVSLPMDVSAKNQNKAQFSWSAVDGSVAYRVTVERYDWLKTGAGSVRNIVWVPSRIEITRTETSQPTKRTFREIPRA